MKQFLVFIMLLCASFTAYSQGGAPKKFNYQAVPRKADGTLLTPNTPVKVQFIITEDGPVNIKYGEEHITTVSQHGVVNAIVGGGAVSGILPFNFDAIDWKNHSYFLAVAVDIDGNGTFESTEKFASSQLLSVPYALYAEKSGSGGTTGGSNYQWGNGIDIDSSTLTINNTGDINADDDVLKNSNFTLGDVTGSFNTGLEIKANAVTSAEIANQTIQKEDLGSMGATNGQVLKYNSATNSWGPAADETSGGGGGTVVLTGQAPGITVTQNSTNNFTIVNTGDTNAGDDLTNTSVAGGDVSGNFSNLQIASGAVGSSEIQNGSIEAVDMGQMGATPSQVLQWDGAKWAPATITSGPGGGLTQVAVNAPLNGNGTSGSPIGIAPNSIGSNLIQDGSVTIADLAAGTIPTIFPPSGSASGDLSGTYPAPLVDGLQGFPVSATPPTSQQVLKWNGTAWAPAADATGGAGGGDNWGTQSAITTSPVTGNGTAGNPIGIAPNSINSSHIADGSINSADLAPGVILNVTAGTGIALNYNTSPGYSIQNTAPDVPVVLTGAGGTTVTGSYPNFTISSTSGGGGGVGGSGTSGYVPKFTGATTIANSAIYQATGNKVGIGTTTPDGNLDINGGELVLHNGTEAFNMTLRSDGKMAFEANGATGDNTLVIDDDDDRSVNIGTSTPVPGFKLHVAGKAKFDTGVYFGTVEGLTDGGLNEIASNSDFRPLSTTATGNTCGTTAHRWANLFSFKGSIADELIVGTTSTSASGAALRVSGAESDGSTVGALRVESPNQTMFIDGNEIDAAGSLFLNYNSAGNVYVANGGGKVVINNAAATGDLNVAGTAYKTGGGSWASFSDRRLKQNIVPFSAGLELINKIKPVTFHYNGKLGMSPDPEYVGIIAQELQEVAPFMVTPTPITEGESAGETYLSVDPSAFTYLLINSVKSQQTEIDSLRNQLEVQQGQINALIADFAALKASAGKAKPPVAAER